MRSIFSNKNEEILFSLSERLRYLAPENNSYKDFIDQNIKSENLLYNLSLIISHIILKLCFIERGFNEFNNVVEEYNKNNKTQLLICDFENIHWIRKVAGEYVIPEVVMSFIYRIERDEKDGKHIDFLKGKEDLIRCLQSYYKQYFEESKLTIIKADLKDILDKYARGTITIEFLLDKKILVKSLNSDTYYWKSDDFSRHLRNEIASTLWLLIGNEEASDKEFAQYFKLINGTGIWFDDLKNYLNSKQTTKISELALSYLYNESDLIGIGSEFNKIWLDSTGYLHVKLGDSIPTIEFNYESPYDFIESVNYYKWHLPGFFDYQRTRSYCHSLLRLIVICDSQYPTPYQNVIKIISDTKRPFLLWTLYQDIQREYSFVIPYLLTDFELAPLAFKLIDKINLDTTLTPIAYEDRKSDNHDVKSKVRYEVINSFWDEMFDFILDKIDYRESKVAGKLLCRIIIDLTEKVFAGTNNNNDGILNHKNLRKRYEVALSKLKEKRIINAYTYPRPLIHPRLVFLILPDIIIYIQEIRSKFDYRNTERLSINAACLDLCIELLRFSNLTIHETELEEKQIEKLHNSSVDLALITKEYITKFYTVDEVDVKLIRTSVTEKRKSRRGINNFGFEIIDWGYIFLYLNKYNLFEQIHENFIKSLKFNAIKTKYDEVNVQQYEKIRFYLQSIMLAFVSINVNTLNYNVEELPVKSTLEKLEDYIVDISLTHSRLEIKKKRINAFDEGFTNAFGGNIYYKKLSTLLFKCVNSFTKYPKIKFIQEFFDGNADIGKMLNAVNVLESNKLQKVIGDMLNKSKIEKFINSKYYNELDPILIDAINSDKHWKLAKQLFEKLEKHYKSISHLDENKETFLFEISLLLSFKENDRKKLNEIAVPHKEYYHKPNIIGENLKKYYSALFMIYNEKKYRPAIVILKSLLLGDSKNVKYAFYLYRAQILDSIKNKSDLKLMFKAHKDWLSFISGLDKDEQRQLDVDEHVLSNEIIYYTGIKDVVNFDLTINKLSNHYLFTEELIPLIFNFYNDRKLYELAFEFINNAKDYFKNNDEIIPKYVKDFLSRPQKASLLKTQKQSLTNIRGLKASEIPQIVPDVINDKDQLNEFILDELIQSIRILIDKIEAIRELKHENRFTDFLQAILKLRLTIWGWSINDESRLGTSTAGSDAGRGDLTIQASGRNIALIEAFILGSQKYTIDHILKCPNYVRTLKRAYVIVYYLGASSKFEKKWLDYKSTVLKINYPETFSIDVENEFVDLFDNFEDVNNLKIAKTIHTSNFELFHVMINLGK